MPRTVVSDTSCFIALANINELTLLKELYNNLLTTPEIASEFGEKLPEWIMIKSPQDQQKLQMLEFQVDKGEASAIALALEIAADLIILDDYKARLTAEKLGLAITGTLGIIIKAKNQGLINTIKPLLTKLQQTNFRLTKSLMDEALKEAGEQ